MTQFVELHCIGRMADLTIEKLADTATSCSCGGRHCH